MKKLLALLLALTFILTFAVYVFAMAAAVAYLGMTRKAKAGE